MPPTLHSVHLNSHLTDGAFQRRSCAFQRGCTSSWRQIQCLFAALRMRPASNMARAVQALQRRHLRPVHPHPGQLLRAHDADGAAVHPSSAPRPAGEFCHVAGFLSCRFQGHLFAESFKGPDMRLQLPAIACMHAQRPAPSHLQSSRYERLTFKTQRRGWGTFWQATSRKRAGARSSCSQRTSLQQPVRLQCQPAVLSGKVHRRCGRCQFAGIHVSLRVQ